MKNVMVDIETLGSKNGSEIISIGAVRFDKSGVGEGFYTTVDCSELGLKVDPATLEWWSKQSPEAQTILTEKRVHYSESFPAFNDFVNDARLWGFGSTFDNVQLRIALEKAGIKAKWHYREDCCFRTLTKIGAHLNLPWVRIGTHHNAYDDALSQAVYAVQIFQKMGIQL
jgi:hypothetical protein